jgi:hypothetical protein
MWYKNRVGNIGTRRKDIVWIRIRPYWFVFKQIKTANDDLITSNQLLTYIISIYL